MKRFSLFALLLALAVMAGACGSDSDETATTELAAEQQADETTTTTTEATTTIEATTTTEATSTTTEATTTTTETEVVEPTAVEILAESAAGDPAEFTILLAAIEAAGLVDETNGPGPFTMLAPTDAAFEALLEDLGITAEELLARPDLVNTILYHTVNGEYLSAKLLDIAPADLVTLAGANRISVSIVDGSVVFNAVATVTTPDVMASNGVIHIIDTVLIP